MLNAQVDYGRQYLDQPETGNQIDGLVEQCHDLVSAHGDASGTALASRVLEEYIALEDSQRLELLCRLNDAFGVDAEALADAARSYADAPDGLRSNWNQVKFTPKGDVKFLKVGRISDQ